MKNESLCVKNLSKKLNEGYAVRNVTIRMFCGEILGIIGKADSGVFALSGILAGDVSYDAGNISVYEKPLKGENSEELIEAGVCHITSTPKLHMGFSVWESICTTNPPVVQKKIVTGKALKKAAEHILQKYNINIDPEKKNYQLTPYEHIIVEIMRAVIVNRNILILENILHPHDQNANRILHKLLRDLAADGKTIVSIGTDVSSPLAIADRLLVMRQGEVWGVFHKNMFEIVEARELFESKPRSNKKDTYFEDKPVLLELKNITVENYCIGYAYIKEGEVVGFMDSSGNAFEPIAQLLNGNAVYGGEVWLRGKLIQLNSKRAAIKNHIGYITKYDDEQMVMDNMTIEDNILLIKLSEYTKIGFIRKKWYSFASGEYLAEYNIPQSYASLFPIQVTSRIRAIIPRIKWDAVKPSVMVMFNSFAGMDRQMYEDAYAYIEKLRKRGVGIVLIVSGKEEAIEICDRIYTVERA